MKPLLFFLLCTLLAPVNYLFAQQKKETTVSTTTIEAPSEVSFNLRKQQQSATTGTVTVEGKKINYRAVAGTLVLKNDLDSPTVSMSYVAYFKDDEDAARRPITFTYNGGPGSATIWLHMGAFGPQRVNLEDTVRTQAPFKTVNNEYSLLDVTDLVFIDAPGTGFGQVITKERGGAGDPKNFYSIDGDANAFADFIARFISDFNRWNSPKFLFGESYGTFRSAVVCNLLQRNKNISLNGVMLLSQLFSYNNMSDIAHMHPGEDLAYELALPTFAATAWYHNKLPNQGQKLETLLKDVEQFAIGDYAVALNKGSWLDSADFNAIAEKLHNYTGLPVDYIRKANLRISGPQFAHELLRNENAITGRLDSRFASGTFDPLGEYAEYDPMDSYIDAAFTAVFNNYVRTQLRFGQNVDYKTSGNLIQQWDFRHLSPGSRFPKPFFANVMSDMAQAMIFNPQLKVMLNMGYFDLGTPFFEGVYEMHHLPIPASLQKNIEYDYYQSGHMVYLHNESLKQLHDNVVRFINGANAQSSGTRAF